METAPNAGMRAFEQIVLDIDLFAMANIGLPRPTIQSLPD